MNGARVAHTTKIYMAIMLLLYTGNLKTVKARWPPVAWYSHPVPWKNRHIIQKLLVGNTLVCTHSLYHNPHFFHEIWNSASKVGIRGEIQYPY